MQIKALIYAGLFVFDELVFKLIDYNFLWPFHADGFFAKDKSKNHRNDTLTYQAFVSVVSFSSVSIIRSFSLFDPIPTADLSAG